MRWLFVRRFNFLDMSAPVTGVGFALANHWSGWQIFLLIAAMVGVSVIGEHFYGIEQ